ncbi:MAG: selenide, water dikinase SelD [Kangiellaceae bacterium]|jgi:selenide,water dikinase|nr:selenide, water dikinase SelD [Kangiellaceae bacterium]
MSQVKLTQYSHGAGCGCKISPSVLSTILASELKTVADPNLLVGNEDRDDAAVYQINQQQSVISTTDFFMPIVDDPTDFGRIAATNALSDIYAMAGKPIMAIAILGWPLDKLSADVAQQVVEGGRIACREAGIMLAGGHSIDAPEPIFGLAVTGLVNTEQVKKNGGAQVGDRLLLSKPLGIGIYSTAQKKGHLTATDAVEVVALMTQLNTLGQFAGEWTSVNAMTDVTGFGLAGHLTEMCQAANVSALVNTEKLPLLSNIDHYLELGCEAGGALRNFQSYGENLLIPNQHCQSIVCDPQTSGGLLIAINPQVADEFINQAATKGCQVTDIGEIIERSSTLVEFR